MAAHSKKAELEKELEASGPLTLGGRRRGNSVTATAEGAPVAGVDVPSAPESEAGDLELGDERLVNRMFKLMGLLYKPHPWHGISLGPDMPHSLNVYIEIVPTDTLKYELDKKTGYLRVDRPNKFSSVSPVAYGFLPQTLAGDRVAKLCKDAVGVDVKGDNDPLDVCVLSERSFTHGNILLTARPIGGFRMIDGGEADDKIIAVMKDDNVYGDWRDISDIPDPVLKRMLHYFLTYKQSPTDPVSKVSIPEIYGAEKAHAVIVAGREDYIEKYADLRSMLATTIFQAVISAAGQSEEEA
eukprot:a175657_443.p2 GENE.a175657_443~~a175657_443.p2  ORF type:complete len:309 (-),score=144.02 a175657_443:56-949(-)